MARPFNSGDARRLVAEHHALLERLAAVDGALDGCRREIIAIRLNNGVKGGDDNECRARRRTQVG